MNSKQRIELTDSFMSAAVKLSEGNPGALTAVMELFRQTPAIDPDAAFGGFAGLFSLDVMGVYGSRIWMFYKDVCHQDMVRMVGLQRAVQLGLLREEVLLNAIDGRPPMSIEDADALVARVQERLPAFNSKQAAKVSA